ncbi:HIRAN domain-containing protein [Pedobacter antarcticus]|uniref:HIRAN domain-containing protein n=2 Tax=Pedobacter antarcticus TaxID=34086 RepID=A0A081PFT2_9SPHI|nr:HIRAN domain-containing protein [Pedobacter antarcticus]KEQ29555.1 hypothetical protein N180_04125 [Pedobacter antarcticus 4BY]SDM21106.1 hypothetical protein SAMN04488084_104311 [Pedobacter antarcticus]SFF10057.1 hypothetical protein SAMN03003324_02376 [Pedobacter antarcticus]
MKAIGNIYLTWRTGRGSSRFPVGTIKKSATGGVRFQYNKEVVAKAQVHGFVPYEGFPDLDKVYTENVIDIFGQRLIRNERNDVQDFYKFWGIDLSYKEDKFYMLAYTQGLLPTDNYEFLADFNPIKGLGFITEITGLSHHKIPSDTIKIGDRLQYQIDTKNEFDKNAVKVLTQGIILGYIKTIHCRIFSKTKRPFNLTVHGIEKNGVLNRVFLKVDTF